MATDCYDNIALALSCSKVTSFAIALFPGGPRVYTTAEPPHSGARVGFLFLPSDQALAAERISDCSLLFFVISSIVVNIGSALRWRRVGGVAWGGVQPGRGTCHGRADHFLAVECKSWWRLCSRRNGSWLRRTGGGTGHDGLMQESAVIGRLLNLSAVVRNLR
jgi:hypothetical protein